MQTNIILVNSVPAVRQWQKREKPILVQMGVTLAAMNAIPLKTKPVMQKMPNGLYLGAAEKASSFFFDVLFGIAPKRTKKV